MSSAYLKVARIRRRTLHSSHVAVVAVVDASLASVLMRKCKFSEGHLHYYYLFIKCTTRIIIIYHQYYQHHHHQQPVTGECNHFPVCIHSSAKAHTDIKKNVQKQWLKQHSVQLFFLSSAADAASFAAVQPEHSVSLCYEAICLYSGTQTQCL